ncbi:type VI secretion system baseplate subunit TssE [Paraburkholderia tropica]|uniref:type VI secretion system baseplate subunit TssE n=1 Tax=Paraburkholderia tropica TaxID=92647 RepID=UPI0007EDE4C3|nr:type VI secretion system baseplate subunit TssE [Paraburkholderia tropica]OBR48511.1 type VI secretion protein [Paraburkholderia tropica]
MMRFEPGLFDKVFYHAPDSATVRTLSLEELKAAVAQDLESLLNTRMVFSEEDLAGFPECSRSILTYGLTDFSGRSLASHDDRKFICECIARAIARHERRLVDVRVTLELRAPSAHALHFAIQAMLIVHPAQEPVSFDAQLQPSTHQYLVTRARNKALGMFGG